MKDKNPFPSRAKSILVTRALTAESKEWAERVDLPNFAGKVGESSPPVLVALMRAAYEEGFHDATRALVDIGYAKSEE